MGHRANLILIENHNHTLYYCHWCAKSLVHDLFWGPEYARAFARIQREVDDTGWLDDVWAEGGAVIDCDNDVLLLWGGEDIRYDVPLRRVYLDMLRQVWSPWTVRWAYEGIAEMADYVHHPRTEVLSRNHERFEPSLDPPEYWGSMDSIASIRLTDGALRLYPVAGYIEEILPAGPDFIRRCSHTRGRDDLSLEHWEDNDFPDGGFHIDLTNRSLDYWTTRDIPGVPDRIKAMWGGWNVTWHHDMFETQLEATEGHLVFPYRSPAALQEGIVGMLLHEYGKSHVDMLMQTIDVAHKDAKTIEINSFALRDDRLEISLEERRRIIVNAMKAINNG